MSVSVSSADIKNVPSIHVWEAAGLEDVSHADVPKKYISVHKDSGVISVAGTDEVLGDSKTAFKIVPLFQYTEWNYVSTDGMKIMSRELRHEKNRNINLKDEEIVTIKDEMGKDTHGIRRLTRTLLVLVSDREHEGPMFLSAMRSKRWAMEATLMNKFLENQKKRLPIFGQEFLVSSEQKVNKKGQKFYVYNFKPGDYIKDDSKLAAYYELYTSLKNSQERLLHANESTEEDATPF